MQNQILQGDYTSLGGSFQLCLSLNFEFQIPKDDPVRLLRHFVDEMDLSALYQTFSQANKNRVQPRQMFAILIYAYLDGIYGSRRIESACRRDINFMYLLEGKPAPDHATIARFRSKHVAPCAKRLLAQIAHITSEHGIELRVNAASKQREFLPMSRLTGTTVAS